MSAENVDKMHIERAPIRACAVVIGGFITSGHDGTPLLSAAVRVGLPL
jgi:hypothetical protein